MKKLKKLISLIICAVLTIGLMPQFVNAAKEQDGICTIETGTIYVLVAEKSITYDGQTFQVGDIQDGGRYLIIAGNSEGNLSSLRCSGNQLTTTTVAVEGADDSVPRVYVQDPGDAAVWTAHQVSAEDEGPGLNWTFSSDNRYLHTENGSLSVSKQDKTEFTIREHAFSWNESAGPEALADEPMPIRSAATPSTIASRLYFYEETKLTRTYSLGANDVQLLIGGTMGVNDIVRQLKVNGRDLGTNLNGTYSYSIVEGNDFVSLENNILTGLACGSAKLRVSYAWDSNAVWTEVNVVVGMPHYAVDIREGGISRSSIAWKQVRQGDTLKLSAQVNAGSLAYPEATVTWTSSNADVADVDQEGMITFTGSEGTTVILASFTYINNAGKEVTVFDQVAVTASTGTNILPSDGTDDFPEYPHEGSVRLDKIVTSMGCFNELGMVEVELSMTGIPSSASKKLDVVLMLDESSSMTTQRRQATIAATEVFLRNLLFHEDGSFTGNRIFIGSFQGGSSHGFRINYITNSGAYYQTVTTQDQFDTLIRNVRNVLTAEGGDPAPSDRDYAQSLEFCCKLLDGSKSDGNQQFCVFLTDGIPTVYQGENSKLQTPGAMARMFTGGQYKTRKAEGNSHYQYERYSSFMKANGVTVFAVGLGLHQTGSALSGATADQCENAASILLNDISGPAGETANNRDTGSTLSKRDAYFFSIGDENADESLADAFGSIAKKIQSAARDVKVTDRISGDYTMVFDAPTAAIAEKVSKEELYIAVMDYALDPVADAEGNVIDHVRGTAFQKMKLYLGQNDDGSYYAAADASGTPYVAPSFEQKPIGSMYYWTTNDIRASASYSGVSITLDQDTYYFDTNGVSGNSHAAPGNWYNLTSGAYAFGTPTIIAGKTPGQNATVSRDLVIATPHFVYQSSSRKLIWTLDKFSSSEIALRYPLYLEGAATGADREPDPGTYPTSVETTLAYTNFQDNPVRQEYPQTQMTWQGMQASYVFYLVNELGQPVNHVGQVVPMSEAVYVTDVRTVSFTSPGAQEPHSLGAELKARELVPSAYTLYDPTATYTIHAFADETAMRQNNHFMLGGSTNTTFVYNSRSDHMKYNRSGVYGAVSRIMCKDYNVTTDGDSWKYLGSPMIQYQDQNGDYVYGTDETGPFTIVYKTSDRQVAEGFNFCDTTVAFAVRWVPSLAPDEVVIDYGLDVLVDVATNDMGVTEPVGLMAAAPEGVAINSGILRDFDRASVLASLGIRDNDGRLMATASMEGKHIRFRLSRENGMQLTQDFTFYYVSSVSYYKNNALVTDYMYTKVRVVPATTMYYEEDFLSSVSGWSFDGSMPFDGVQDVDRPGFNRISEANDANNVYGYDSHYLNAPTYSQNAALVGRIGDTAVFTFNGTGFDLISRRDSETACILIRMTKDGSPVKFTAELTGENHVIDAEGESIFVNPYYKSGNGIRAIPQSPVVSVHGLDYGTYTVTVEVVDSNKNTSGSGNNGANRFCLDAIRVYDPIGIRNYTDPVGMVYILDNEWKPAYETFRDVALTVYGNVPFDGIYFIDQVGNATEIADCNNWGPNSEFYLSPGTSIELRTDSTFMKSLVSKTTGGLADMQLGIQLLKGKSATLTIRTRNERNAVTGHRQVEITSGHDLRFSLMDLYNGTITITNNGNGIVALTTVKLTLLPPVTTATHNMHGNLNVTTPPQQAHTEPIPVKPDEVPANPQGVISNVILGFKETFAAVIIAVADAMDGFSKWLQDVARALFS